MSFAEQTILTESRILAAVEACCWSRKLLPSDNAKLHAAKTVVWQRDSPSPEFLAGPNDFSNTTFSAPTNYNSKNIFESLKEEAVEQAEQVGHQSPVTIVPREADHFYGSIPTTKQVEDVELVEHQQISPPTNLPDNSNIFGESDANAVHISLQEPAQNSSNLFISIKQEPADNEQRDEHQLSLLPNVIEKFVDENAGQNSLQGQAGQSIDAYKTLVENVEPPEHRPASLPRAKDNCDIVNEFQKPQSSQKLADSKETVEAKHADNVEQLERQPQCSATDKAETAEKVGHSFREPAYMQIVERYWNEEREQNEDTQSTFPHEAKFIEQNQSADLVDGSSNRVENLPVHVARQRRKRTLPKCFGEKEAEICSKRQATSSELRNSEKKSLRNATMDMSLVAKINEIIEKAVREELFGTSPPLCQTQSLNPQDKDTIEISKERQAVAARLLRYLSEMERWVPKTSARASGNFSVSRRRSKQGFTSTVSTTEITTHRNLLPVICQQQLPPAINCLAPVAVRHQPSHERIPLPTCLRQQPPVAINAKWKTSINQQNYQVPWYLRPPPSYQEPSSTMRQRPPPAICQQSLAPTRNQLPPQITSKFPTQASAAIFPQIYTSTNQLSSTFLRQQLPPGIGFQSSSAIHHQLPSAFNKNSPPAMGQELPYPIMLQWAISHQDGALSRPSVARLNLASRMREVTGIPNSEERLFDSSTNQTILDQLQSEVHPWTGKLKPDTFANTITLATFERK